MFRGCHFESENVHESCGRFVNFMDYAAELSGKLGQFLVHFVGYFVGLLLFSDRVHSIDVSLARLLDKTCKFLMHIIKKIYNKSEAINILTTIKLHRVHMAQADHVKQTHVTHKHMWHITWHIQTHVGKTCTTATV